ncbi:hypothetical protein [Piscinibacter sp.]|uniref:hypothetical protein n=1 Tax=Piscinibacter sp. TaxID=1903157 RepID=UPI002C8EB1CE|nr:hypothetical protein [Albitalea sp.]HUG25380.1 hypothetical protein [Albitalea sp.]
MRLPRKHRVLTALIALVGMLFMQLAVAAYACPGSSESAPPTAMADCDEADSAAPALCHAHCQDGQTSLDKPEVRTAAAVMFFMALVEPVSAGTQARFEPASLLRRSTAPPISIRHCCLRF